jgi:hypothetical protein
MSPEQIKKLQGYSEGYCNIISKYLHGKPDAQSWLLLYGIYAHAVDDVIDEKTDNTHKLRTFETALILYNHVYYRRYCDYLYALCKIAHTAYADSVRLERSENKIDQLIADPLRQYGNELILFIIELEEGKEARDAASIELRKLSWETHHNEDGKPV